MSIVLLNLLFASSVTCLRLASLTNEIPNSPWLRDGSNCSKPMRPESLPRAEADKLKQKIADVSKTWGYKWEGFYAQFKGNHVLDVGMGQGPWGVAALTSGNWLKYTGMDPAICINQFAKTRDHAVGHTSSRASCKAHLQSPACQGKDKGSCEEYVKCASLLDSKYKPFPFTGLQMMQAFEPNLLLIPGTFESVAGTDMMVHGSFDAATLRTVTEHLQDVHGVLKGIHKMLKPGQKLHFDHHNYYGYDGHHTDPTSPAQMNALPPDSLVRACGDWGHLDKACPSFAKEGLNRLRLGDLVALVNIYFEDCYHETTTGQSLALQKRNKDAVDAAFEKRKHELTERGFVREELIISHYRASCKARAEPGSTLWVEKASLWHPPTDGSYTPQKLPAFVKPPYE